MRQKLRTKDYILIGIFSILIYIVNAIVGIALTPVMAFAMPLISGVCLFFSATVYLVMAMKIGKRGTLLLMAVVTGLIYTIMGVPLMLAFFILAGLIGEAVLFKGDGGQYRRISRQALAYAAYGALFGLGAYVTIYVYGSDYLEAMYDPEMRERMAYFAYSPVWIIGSSAFSFILTLLGSLLAAKLLRKHFMKSGLIK
ncbi:hypothetical protein DMN77_16160 [Paenibacillus sp. 79R4]|uniref:MptD family putative ECF transporter S component n=1 Tax=Paenibacillus sp. 79R4 TaxID=2212847 RepID=UPI0015B99E34|nr:MptD family putative ECF transporter S component [Paenibacillus sp. 79R4]NWL89093.1 hypothetical protein [Paenibacillus sp. 79R4]